MIRIMYVWCRMRLIERPGQFTVPAWARLRVLRVTRGAKPDSDIHPSADCRKSDRGGEGGNFAHRVGTFLNRDFPSHSWQRFRRAYFTSCAAASCQKTMLVAHLPPQNRLMLLSSTLHEAHLKFLYNYFHW